MKTTTKKRALVSSVAMLLVAMLALGTATFAWFTQSTQVTASGVNVTSAKPSQLEISDATRAYSSAGFTYQNATKNLVPVSTGNGKNWFAADAASSDSYALKEGSIVSADSNLSKYVFKDQLNIHNAGDNDFSEITISFTLSENSDKEYVRVALVPVGSKGASVEIPSGTTFGSYVYDNDGVAYSGINSTAGGETSITPEDNTTVTISDGLAAGGELHYNLYVWFEGNDVECNDTNGTYTVGEIEFVVNGTPA